MVQATNKDYVDSWFMINSTARNKRGAAQEGLGPAGYFII